MTVSLALEHDLRGRRRSSSRFTLLTSGTPTLWNQTGNGEEEKEHQAEGVQEHGFIAFSHDFLLLLRGFKFRGFTHTTFGWANEL